MKLSADVRNPIGDIRLVSADDADYEAAKLALQPLIDDDEQVLSYRRIKD